MIEKYVLSEPVTKNHFSIIIFIKKTFTCLETSTIGYVRAFKPFFFLFASYVGLKCIALLLFGYSFREMNYNYH